jgi:hypothetical protein
VSITNNDKPPKEATMTFTTGQTVSHINTPSQLLGTVEFGDETGANVIEPDGDTAWFVAADILPFTAPVLPMPNDEFDGGTVIASCWQNDDLSYGPAWYTLLLLTNQPGEFYRVVNVDAATSKITADTIFPNIIPAAEAYSEAIGGY